MREQIGSHTIVDLVDHEKVKSIRVLRRATFADLKQMGAFSFPTTPPASPFLSKH